MRAVELRCASREKGEKKAFRRSFAPRAAPRAPENLTALSTLAVGLVGVQIEIYIPRTLFKKNCLYIARVAPRVSLDLEGPFHDTERAFLSAQVGTALFNSKIIFVGAKLALAEIPVGHDLAKALDASACLREARRSLAHRSLSR